jgi:sec-independent protein translocase protein TatA
MPDIGVPELLIVAVIVLLLFGPAKAADLGGALGKSIREFRKASSEDADAPSQLASSNTTATATNTSAPPTVDAPSSAAPAGAVAMSAARKYCTSCGSAIGIEQRFCTSCGTQRVA